MIAFAADVDLFSYTGETDFTDVPKEAWYAPAVQWANENGLVMGQAATIFAPNNNITREEAVAMIYRLAEFQDSKVIGWCHYEIPEESKEELNSSEIEEITEMLNLHTLEDENEVSDWAKETYDVIQEACNREVAYEFIDLCFMQWNCLYPTVDTFTEDHFSKIFSQRGKFWFLCGIFNLLCVTSSRKISCFSS